VQLALDGSTLDLLDESTLDGDLRLGRFAQERDVRRSVISIDTMNIGIAYDLKSEHEARAGVRIGDVLSPRAGNCAGDRGENRAADRADGRDAVPACGPDDRLEEYDSSETVEAIAAALAARGHEPVLLGSGHAFLERVLARKPDLVFNIAEGFGSRSREAHVPSACEMLGIPVTHSDPLTLAVTLDKAMAKRLVTSAGVATPRFAIVESASDVSRLALDYPLIAKPLFEGSSMGIRRSSRVEDVHSLQREVERLAGDYAQPVLVEEFCSGAEFTVGVLGNGPSRDRGEGSVTKGSIAGRPSSSSCWFVAAMEIAPRVDRLEAFVYSLEVKRNWRSEVEYHVPPRCSSSTTRAVEELALAAYRALGCRDVARVDVRLTAQGEPRFLEVNPLPGLNPATGDLVILCERSGLPYEELVARIVENARARYGI
jgi:D-alanine-D-alanine ligase